MTRVLYVRHSGRIMDLSAIEDLFATVGDVESSKLEAILDSSSDSKAGILVMSTAQQASDCVERFHGQVLNGYQLSVKITDR